MKLLNFAAVVLALTSSSIAGVQTVSTPIQTARLEVVFSTIDNGKSVSSVPFNFRLQLGQSGTLKVTEPVTESSVPQPCGTSLGGTQLVGTEVNATVKQSREQEGRFDIQVEISERSLAGCRSVGDITVPVFLNRSFKRDLTLEDGDATDVQLESGKNSNIVKIIKVRLSLIAK